MLMNASRLLALLFLTLPLHGAIENPFALDASSWHSSTYTLAQFNAALKDRALRRVKSAEEATEVKNIFIRSLNGDTIQDPLNYINALWHSGLREDDFLDAAILAKEQLIALNRERRGAAGSAYLNALLRQFHDWPTRATMELAKRSFFRELRKEFLALSSLKSRTLHTPTKPTLAMGATSLGAVGLGAYWWKRMNAPIDARKNAYIAARKRFRSLLGQGMPEQKVRLAEKGKIPLTHAQEAALAALNKASKEYYQLRWQQAGPAALMAAGALGTAFATRYHLNHAPF